MIRFNDTMIFVLSRILYGTWKRSVVKHIFTPRTCTGGKAIGFVCHLLWSRIRQIATSGHLSDS